MDITFECEDGVFRRVYFNILNEEKEPLGFFICEPTTYPEFKDGRLLRCGWGDTEELAMEDCVKKNGWVHAD